MLVASFVISLFALIAAGGSTWYARRIWVLERDRDVAQRTPSISAVFEDYGGDYPAIEITNDGEEDMASVSVELRDPLEGYVPPIRALIEDGGQSTRKVDLGPVAAAETKRVPVERQEEVGGAAILYAHCRAKDGSRWRVTVKLDLSPPPSVW